MDKCLFEKEEHQIYIYLNT